jgi:hypothetical protein
MWSRFLSFFISFLQDSITPHLRYTLPIVDLDGKLLYHADGILELASLPRSPPREIIQRLALMDDVSPDCFRFLDCTGTFADVHVSTSIFLLNLLRCRYFLVFNVPSHCRRNLGERTAVIEEFLWTECAYIEFLSGFPEAVSAFMKKLKPPIRPCPVETAKCIH